MPKHEVLKRILHGDGKSRKLYRKGDVIDLSNDDAKPLIEAAHLAPRAAAQTASDDTSEQANANGAKPIDRMNVAELKGKAASANVTIAEGATKKQIIEALAAAGITE